MQTSIEKAAKKLFVNFPEDTIGRIEVSKKRTHGNIGEIDKTFQFISSKGEDMAHYFGNLEPKAKKLKISKQHQPVFTKWVPKDETERVQLVNNLNRIGLTLEQFDPTRYQR